MEAQVSDWRVLSEAASREQDPEKLMELIDKLNAALLHKERHTRTARSGPR